MKKLLLKNGKLVSIALDTVPALVGKRCYFYEPKSYTTIHLLHDLGFNVEICDDEFFIIGDCSARKTVLNFILKNCTLNDAVAFFTASYDARLNCNLFVTKYNGTFSPEQKKAISEMIFGA